LVSDAGATPFADEATGEPDRGVAAGLLDALLAFELHASEIAMTGNRTERRTTRDIRDLLVVMD
jgi:hypothetical protein